MRRIAYRALIIAAACSTLSSTTVVAQPITQAAPSSARPLAGIDFDSKPPALDFSHLPELEQATNEPDLVDNAQEGRDATWRVAMLGGTLVYRAAAHGYLEAELTRLWPHAQLEFRNLGWAGDDVHGHARAEFGPSERDRSQWRRPAADFGDYGLQKMLSQVKAARPHVVLIAYGSEAAYDADDLSKFLEGLKRLLDNLEPTGSRIYLISPPPRQTHGSATGPLSEQNPRLAAVSEHIRQIATARGHGFMDLFSALSHPGQIARQRWTDNGIDLNAAGYRMFAQTIVDVLEAAVHPWHVHIDAKSHVHSARGTTIDRSQVTTYGLRWYAEDDRLPSVLSNSQPRTSGPPPAEAGDLEIQQRVLQISGLPPGVYTLDIDGRRVSRADAAQWALGIPIVRGPDHDQLSNLRQKVVEKNRLFFYGLRPQNKAYIHLFRRHERGHHTGELQQFAKLVRDRETEIASLKVPRVRHYELVRETDYPDHEVPAETPRPDIDQELAAFDVVEGFEISLFASDPLIANPINIQWDERGRMWVATSTTYPHLQPGQFPDDQIVILEDIDRDGRADKRTVFADGLLVPHSVLPAGNAAYVTQSSDLLLLEDTDGDDQADERRVLLTGFGNADVHHMIHGLRWGPDGDAYFTQSIYINSSVETPWGIHHVHGSCTWRLRPQTLQLQTYSRGLVNPWGFAFDRWGQSFATDGAGGGGIAYTFPGSAFATHGDFARELPSLNPGRPKECGLEVLSGRHLPEDWRGTFLSADFRANRVTHYRLNERGSGYHSEYLGDVVSSRHRAFRPVDVKVGPDGAIYIVDWYNLIIDHGEVDFHHPLRDRGHGRIWRLARKNWPFVEPPKLADASVEELLEALKLPEQWTRDQSRRLLRAREKRRVSAALERWLAELDREHPDYEHHRLEALWVLQGLRLPDAHLLRQTLSSPDHHVRAASVRVLADWHALLEDSRELLATSVADDHPQVRLEAVNALRSLGTRDAAEIALRAADSPLDENLDFALWRTARDLSETWLPSFQAGSTVFDDNPQRLAFALAAVGDRTLLEPLVSLLREGALDAPRRASALQVLARLGSSDEHALVLQELPSLPPDAAILLLRELLGSELQAIPPTDATSAIVLLESPHVEVRSLAIRLMGRGRVRAAIDPLASLHQNSRLAPGDRLAAGESLIAIDPDQGLRIVRDTLEQTTNLQIRATAMAAWLASDIDGVARPAAHLLAQLSDPNDASLLLNVFLQHSEGAALLASALNNGPPLNKEIALEGIRLANQTGRDLTGLVAALQSSANIDVGSAVANRDTIAELAANAIQSGDAARGELIFRRADMNCIKCHAIGGAGGKSGPDLSSLGGSARVVDIIESVLMPSAKIKDGFQTTQVFTDDGRVVSGIVVQQDSSRITIRDANDRLLTIPASHVEDSVSTALSIMPEGLVAGLSREELLDLIQFLAALGRDNAFHVPATSYVRNWEVLDASSFHGDPDSVEQARDDSDIFSGGAAWSMRYSTVAGVLPLAEIPRVHDAEDSAFGYVRFQIPEHWEGAGDCVFLETEGIQIRQDDRWIQLPPDGRIHQHRLADPIVVRVELQNRQSPLAVMVVPQNQ